jgi:hypothetical protein
VLEFGLISELEDSYPFSSSTNCDAIQTVDWNINFFF